MVSPQHFIRWETQRGCPFRCSFCQHKDPQGVKRKFIAQERILTEAEWISRNKEIRDVHVVDPTFNSGPNYLNILEALCINEFSGKIALQTRIEMVTDDFLYLVNQLNKTGKVVLEFGLQTIHPEEQKYIERPTNLKKIRRKLEVITREDIETEVSIIYGLPAQTISSFQESVKFCQESGIPVIYAFPLMLLRGTKLWEKRQELGLVTSEEIANEGIDRLQTGIVHVVSSPSYTYDDWKKMGDIAEDLQKENTKYLNYRDADYLCDTTSVSNNPFTFFYDSASTGQENRLTLLSENKSLDSSTQSFKK